MSNNKYWQSLEQRDETPEFKEQAAKEFQDEMPVFDYVDDTTKVESTGRRDFLKMMGFSISAAAIASSCKIPVKKAIPYVFNLDQSSRIPELVPGIADYFATSYAEGGDFSSILVKTRENRPIKIEGNTAAPFVKGGTTARAQASVLSLYDVARLTQPKKKGESITWEQADSEIAKKLTKISAEGGKIVIISNTNYSLATQKALATFKAKYPTTQVVTYDPVSLYAIRKANQITLGESIIPTYLFDKAKVIAGFNCDFLGGFVNATENAKRYSANRVPTKENPNMSRHYHFQSYVSITSASADYKHSIKPSQEKAVLMALYNKIAASTGASSLANVTISDLQESVNKLAAELLANRGESIVISGTNNVDIQLLTNAINAMLGNYGSTIDTAAALNLKQGNDEALKALSDDTSVKAVLLLNSNPVYDSVFADKIKNIITKAELSVSFADRLDESAELVQYITPDNHYLESWDVLEPKKGYISFVQPTINQLFDTRQAFVSLSEFAGATTTAYDLIKSAGEGFTTGFIASLGNTSWESALQTGFINNVSESASGSANLSATVSAINTKLPTSNGIEVIFYESVALADGKEANNPFLQEMPDPITRTSWDNFIALPYTFAINNGIKAMSQDSTVKTAKITLANKEVVLPVIISYGQAQDTVAIALGYGRSQGVGPAAFGSGQNVYPFLTYDNGTVSYSAGSAAYETLKGTHKMGMSQRYHTLQEDNNLYNRPRRFRNNIVKEANLEQFRKDDTAGNEDRAKIKDHLTTLYKGYDSPGHHWSMAVDLNSCIGCAACVISCNIENNVPVIGREEMSNTRSMHWLRIDRYYSGDPDNPDVAFQPLMCQHCDNAPCENVCPVNATNHSSEGLNQMAYNRCIGTKYCANNCPFKVRKFNWYDYQGNDSFGGWNDPTDASYMYDNLTRMVLNPDVTVRSRGVIEKCSFCVQRIQASKLTAKTEGRPLKDGDVKTACQTACPTNSISFGDRNDKNSEIHRIFFDNGRNYHLYEEQHFMTNVGYQVKIRNTDEEPEFTFVGAKEDKA
ncbi:MAG TPA: TAT-variant-translocated molybdopterin oxidoreductase [Chitinophagales bacterium]|nr:TAT-variant-translocated molybdopterin oxidoreductase [Chitinophagales bacterium]